VTTSGVFLTGFIHIAIDGIANVKRDTMCGAFLVVCFSIWHFLSNNTCFQSIKVLPRMVFVVVFVGEASCLSRFRLISVISANT